MKWARWLLPILTIGAIAWLTWRDAMGARVGPGPLHSAHAAVAALQGGANCEGCHRVGAGVEAAACTSCHAPIAKQLAERTGLHGAVPDELRSRCEACHGEHHGDASPLIAAHGWTRLGIATVGDYDHRHVTFGLEGAHRGLACDRCHREADAAAPPTGGRFLGLSQQCTSCHEDRHRGAFGTDCASCHGQERPWAEAPRFPHESFPLVGAHGRAKCAQCHPEAGARSVVALREQPLQARGCADCHDNPHGEPPLPVLALRLPRAADCLRCHTTEDWRPLPIGPREHAEQFGYALDGAHAEVGCADCHGDETRASRWRGAPPKASQCASCHDSPHGEALTVAALAAAPKSANGCADCHRGDDRNWHGGTITASQHAAAGFALEVPHHDVACAKCHQGASYGERFAARRPADCRACHADVHAGQFDGKAEYAQCTACHAATHFRPIAFGNAAHAKTKFALTGAHDAVACARCHDRVEDGVRRFVGAATDCAACHADVHAGRFAKLGAADCAVCHTTEAFAPVERFDHARWAGYALDGAHATAACTACHAPAAGRRLGAVLGTSCAACHQDVHAGQFARDGYTDCASCHGNASFAIERFDHSRTAFPLDATHARVDCARCHVGYSVGERTVVRYRPLGTACGDCHKLGGKEER
ncbi:MAG: hypothetical protein RL398_2408 [Planctomycetota bacterium]